MTGNRCRPVWRVAESGIARIRNVVGKGGWPAWILLGFAVLAIIGPAAAPRDPYRFDHLHSLQGPSLSHPFGTDQYGRDLLSRMMTGARTLVAVAGGATVVCLALGVVWGLMAAYLGGRGDEIMMRAADILMTIPGILIAMMILVSLGPSDLNVMFAVALLFSPYVSRVVRSGALIEMSQEYVDAARITGEGMIWIISREILPNLRSILLIEAAVRFGFCVLIIASLGFLGLGVQPPTPDWGLIVYESRHYMGDAPWVVAFPLLGIGGLVLVAHSLADRLANREECREWDPLGDG